MSGFNVKSLVLFRVGEHPENNGDKSDDNNDAEHHVECAGDNADCAADELNNNYKCGNKNYAGYDGNDKIFIFHNTTYYNIEDNLLFRTKTGEDVDKIFRQRSFELYVLTGAGMNKAQAASV